MNQTPAVSVPFSILISRVSEKEDWSGPVDSRSQTENDEATIPKSAGT